jgi:hypothetical protein
MIDRLQSESAEWVLLSHLERSENGRLAPMLEANCGSLELVKHFPERTYLFRLVDPGQNTGVGEACEAVRNYRAATSEVAGPGQ